MVGKIPARALRLLALLLPVASLLAAYLLVVPRSRALQADRAELARTGELVRAKRDLVAAVARQKPETIVAQLPAQPDEPVRFLRELNRVASSCRVTFSAVTTVPAPEAGAVAPVPTDSTAAAGTFPPALQLPAGTVPVILEISAEGTYAQLARFFSRLETYPRLITISDVSMNVVQHPAMTARFRLTRYTGPVAADQTPR